jgi:hypothetical protein
MTWTRPRWHVPALAPFSHLFALSHALLLTRAPPAQAEQYAAEADKLGEHAQCQAISAQARRAQRAHASKPSALVLTLKRLRAPLRRRWSGLLRT